MDKEIYGTRLTGYAEKNGKKLYRYIRDTDREYKLGIIKSYTKETHGPITVQIWELENGEKYHYY